MAYFSPCRYAPNIPLYADKLLFSIDLVNHVLITKWPYLAPHGRAVDSHESYRETIYNGFTETVQQAIDNLCVLKSARIYADYSNILYYDFPNEEALHVYAEKFRDRYFAEEFSARAFLKYCASLALLSGYFLKSGIDDAPEIAMNLIVLAMPEGFVSTPFWDSLHSAAESYC